MLRTAKPTALGPRLLTSSGSIVTPSATSDGSLMNSRAPAGCWNRLTDQRIVVGPPAGASAEGTNIAWKPTTLPISLRRAKRAAGSGARALAPSLSTKRASESVNPGRSVGARDHSLQHLSARGVDDCRGGCFLNAASRSVESSEPLPQAPASIALPTITMLERNTAALPVMTRSSLNSPSSATTPPSSSA